MFSIKETTGKVLEMVAVGLLAPPATWLLCAAAFQLGICSACPRGPGESGEAEQQEQKAPGFWPWPCLPGRACATLLCSGLSEYLKRAVLHGVQYLGISRAFEVWPCLAREVR